MTEQTVHGISVGAGVDLEDIAEPGAFQLQSMDYQPIADPAALPDGTQLRLGYCCPKTGKECGGIIIGKGHKPDIGAPSWHWDGNIYQPTLTPSINCKDCWHGYLTKGEWVAA